jgi:hypothetical protein
LFDAVQLNPFIGADEMVAVTAVKKIAGHGV